MFLLSNCSLRSFDLATTESSLEILETSPNRYHLWGVEVEAAASTDPALWSFANDLEFQWLNPGHSSS